MRYNTLYLVISIIAASALILSCGRSGNTPGGPGGFPGMGGMQRATSVEVRDVNPTSISDQIRSYGSVRAQDNVRVIPQVNERILRIYADLGDTVRVGQSLAKLNDANFREQFERDRAQIEQARSTVTRDSSAFARNQELYQRGLLSDAEMENSRSLYLNSRAAYRTAQASLTQSTQNLGYTEVKSPVTGVITRRNLSPGDLASGGQPIFEISNLVGYEVRLYLPMNDWRRTQIGHSVELSISNTTSIGAQGVVSRISPELDPVTGLGEVVVSLTSRGPDIYPGVLVESRINVITKNNVIVVPRSALVENVQTVIQPESNVIRLNRTYSVFVTQGDSIAVRRELELGIQQGDRIEILSGLRQDEKMIITGQSSLEDGSRIRISGLPRFTQQQAAGIDGQLEQTGADSAAQQTPRGPGGVQDTTRFNQMLRAQGINPSDTAAVRQFRERMQQQRRQN